MAAIIAVGMGDVCVSRSPGDFLTAAGLGSCVGLCLYDPQNRTGAMAHIVLPQTLPPPVASRHSPLAPLPGKCADTAVAFLVAQFAALGTSPSRLRAAVAGGAQIFSYSDTSSSPTLSRLEIGPRNAAAVRDALDAHGIPLLACDLGESCGRTITFCLHTGDVFVRRVGAEEQKLVCLGQPAACSDRERLVAHGH